MNKPFLPKEKRKERFMKSKVVMIFATISMLFSSCAHEPSVQPDDSKNNKRYEWHLMTNFDEFDSGDRIIIASGKNNVAVGTYQVDHFNPTAIEVTEDITEIVDFSNDISALTLYKEGGHFVFLNDDGQYLGVNNDLAITWDDGEKYWDISFENGKANISSINNQLGRLLYNSKSLRFKSYISPLSDSLVLPNIYHGFSTIPLYAEEIKIISSREEVSLGKKLSLGLSFTPSKTNQKEVTWKSDNVAVASVDQKGVVTANYLGVANITATVKTENSSISDTFTLTVTDKGDAWTIMIYMCGSDLESDNSLATADLQEILSVSGQPDDINVLIETGGARKWNTTYGISASKLSRYHVKDQQLVLDEALPRTNMSESSTFQSFLEWGLTYYPAQKTGVILWDHGGGMQGCCYDENYYSSSALLNSKTKKAFQNIFTKMNLGDKLEFIGYDCCLMQVQDIAEFNSPYFRYMVASQEAESGYGWDYDNWLDNLYAYQDTELVLKEIVDTFINDNGGPNSSRNDQQLSYLDLSKMEAYHSAWEEMSSALFSKLNSRNQNAFLELVRSAKHFADSDYTSFGLFDAKDFINKLAVNETFNPGEEYIEAINSAFEELVAYHSSGKKAIKSNGLSMFFAISQYCYQSYYYTSSETNFFNWRTINTTYGL